jgi:hypothetical protein
MRPAAAVALIVLTGRSLAYALIDDPLELGQAAGGPRLPFVIGASAALALFISSAVLWLAALGVNERRLLEHRELSHEPRLKLKQLLPRSAAWFALSALAFALLESTLHWRAGLGWHGLDCLLGPVHRDALPILAALSAVATALAAGLDHVVAWMRRTIVALRAVTRAIKRAPALVSKLCITPAGRPRRRPLGARGPPLAVV